MFWRHFHMCPRFVMADKPEAMLDFNRESAFNRFVLLVLRLRIVSGLSERL